MAGMAEDQYFIIAEHSEAPPEHSGDLLCKILVGKPCSKDTWEGAPKSAEMFNQFNIKHIHGRRINDEVELFPGADGKETKGIRGDMEAMGLTVRMYVPEPKKTVKPRLKLNVAPQPKSLMENCQYALRTAIADWEIATDEPAGPHALIADATVGKGKSAAKRLLVITVSHATWNTVRFEREPDEKVSFEVNGVSYNVIGHYMDGHVHFDISDEKVASFFSLDKPEDEQVNITVFNHIEHQARIDAEEDKKGKKAQKKQRRQEGVVIPTAEELEQMARAKKEKTREKRKAQRVKVKTKKALEAHEKEERKSGLFVTDDEDEGGGEHAKEHDHGANAKNADTSEDEDDGKAGVRRAEPIKIYHNADAPEQIQAIVDAVKAVRDIGRPVKIYRT